MFHLVHYLVFVLKKKKIILLFLSFFYFELILQLFLIPKIVPKPPDAGPRRQNI